MLKGEAQYFHEFAARMDKLYQKAVDFENCDDYYKDKASELTNRYGNSWEEIRGFFTSVGTSTGNVLRGIGLALPEIAELILLKGGGKAATGTIKVTEKASDVGLGIKTLEETTDTAKVTGKSLHVTNTMDFIDDIGDVGNIVKIKVNAIDNVEQLNVTKGAGNPKSKLYNPVDFNGTVKVNGEVRDVSRRVYQRGDIDINYFDENTGLTNLQRMKKGKPPIGSDGNPIQLHHLTQQEVGSMIEILEVTHQEYYSQLHGLVGKGESFRNNTILEKQYNNFRGKYWKWRYEQFTK